MIVTANLGGAYTEIKRSFYLYSDGSATDIDQGELLEEGIDEDDMGGVVDIQTPAGPVNVVGMLMQLYDGSEVGEWDHNGVLTTETNRPFVDVACSPFNVYRAEIAVCATQIITVAAGAGAGTGECVFSTGIGAAEVLNTSWVYNSTDNELRWVEDHETTTDFVFNTDAVAAWASGDSFYICPQRLYGSVANQGFTVSGQKIIVEGNETVLWAKTVDHFISYDGQNEQVKLNPGIHDAQTYTNLKLWIDIIILDHAFNNLS